jgi:hypothetical protein
VDWRDIVERNVKRNMGCVGYDTCIKTETAGVALQA